MREGVGEVAAPVRVCISCNICFERLSRERDVSCVQNPLIGTEFETLACLEPHVNRAMRPEIERRRVLVIGAGVSGVEAARVAA